METISFHLEESLNIPIAFTTKIVTFKSMHYVYVIYVMCVCVFCQNKKSIAVNLTRLSFS